MLNVKSVVFKPSYMCNEHCIMCAHSDQRPTAWVMPWEQAYENLEEVRRLYSFRRFEFVGGEPTIYPSFFQVLEWFQVSYPDRRLLLYTNGLKLSREEFVLQVARFNLIVEMSFLAIDDATNERIRRRRNHLELNIAGLENSLAAGLPVNMNVVVMRENEEQLEDIGRFLGKYPLGRVRFRLPILATKMTDQVMPDLTRFNERVEAAAKHLTPNTHAEIIMMPLCFEGSIPINEEPGEVILVDRANQFAAHRRRSNYSNLIRDNFAATNFRKSAECEHCVYNTECPGLDERNLESLRAVGQSLVPVQKRKPQIDTGYF